MGLVRSLAQLGLSITDAPDRRMDPRRQLDGAFTVLLQDQSGEIRPSVIRAVNVSDRGIAFRAEHEYKVGQNLLVTDREDIVEVVVRSKHREGDDLIYGAEVVQSAELPDKFMHKVPESFGRLAEEMELETKRVAATE